MNALAIPDTTETAAAGFTTDGPHFAELTDAILIIEGEAFVDANQAAIDMLGFSTREEVLRTHPSKVSPPTQPDGRDSFEKANEMIAKLMGMGSNDLEKKVNVNGSGISLGHPIGCTGARLGASDLMVAEAD